MLKTGATLAELYELTLPSAKNRTICDLRIGLGYIGVRLDKQSTGLAALLFDALPQGCTIMPAAGSYAGSKSAELLKFLITGKNPLEMAIGLATANALIEPPKDNIDDREATTYFHLQKGVKVTMVGLFSPLVARIQATGAELTIIEKNSARLNILNDAEKNKALQNCDIAIITATTLLNGTFEETINSLGMPCCVAIMGPSTPLVPAIFRKTPVTHLGGVVVADSARVLQIISEGGGTPALRPYLHFVNMIRK